MLPLQDVLKLMTGQGMKMDAETQEAFRSKDRSGIAASVEALKTRKAAQAMTKALRQFNPKLAKALIDDRDEVGSHAVSILTCYVLYNLLYIFCPIFSAIQHTVAVEFAWLALLQTCEVLIS